MGWFRKFTNSIFGGGSSEQQTPDTNVAAAGGVRPVNLDGIDVTDLQGIATDALAQGQTSIPNITAEQLQNLRLFVNRTGSQNALTYDEQTQTATLDASLMTEKGRQSLAQIGEVPASPATQINDPVVQPEVVQEREAPAVAESKRTELNGVQKFANRMESDRRAPETVNMVKLSRCSQQQFDELQQFINDNGLDAKLEMGTPNKNGRATITITGIDDKARAALKGNEVETPLQEVKKDIKELGLDGAKEKRGRLERLASKMEKAAEKTEHRFDDALAWGVRQFSNAVNYVKRGVQEVRDDAAAVGEKYEKLMDGSVREAGKNRLQLIKRIFVREDHEVEALEQAAKQRKEERQQERQTRKETPTEYKQHGLSRLAHGVVEKAAKGDEIANHVKAEVKHTVEVGIQKTGEVIQYVADQRPVSASTYKKDTEQLKQQVAELTELIMKQGGQFNGIEQHDGTSAAVISGEAKSAAAGKGGKGG